MSIQLPSSDAYVLTDVRIPAALVETDLPVSGEMLACDIQVRGGRLTLGLRGAFATSGLQTCPILDGMVLPRTVDIHTHLDKGHIWGRAPNPDGTFLGARMSVAGDREAHWSATDVERRMEFALRCAYAHGTRAIRTHLDSIGSQVAITWPVFAAMREAWKDRIEMQAVALFPTEWAIDDEPQFRSIVATVAKQGGLLGGLTFMGEALTEKLDRALDRVMQAAAANGLDLDFHVDESDSPHAVTLERIANAAIRTKYKGRIVAGHCCSLALQSETDQTRVINRLGEARIAIVSLPMCNMYLQDRTAGRTPRWRGVAPLHELDAAGITSLIASDNTRDPFYAYGDLDMLEVFREATRIVHFDHSARPWARLLGPAPAAVMGIEHGTIRDGGAADLIVLSARSWNEAQSRPQADRLVLHGGRVVSRKLPDYRELDATAD